jgi:hypothetical protein
MKGKKFSMKSGVKRALPIFAIALLSFNMTVSGAEITINKAEQDETGYVNVECAISDAEETQQITTVAREYTASNDDVDAIVYINQYEPEITDGKFEYTFNAGDSLEETKVYLLRVGGTNVDKAAQRIIAVSGKEVYVLGDVNSDGVIDDIDAELVLKYIGGVGELDGTELKAANVISADGINMLDVIKLLSLYKSN